MTTLSPDATAGVAVGGESMNFDRRTLVLAAGAVAMAPAVLRYGLGSALAQAPAAAPTTGLGDPAAQAPGFYRLKLGSRHVTLVNDGFGRRPKPTEGFVRNAEAGAVQAALEEAFLPTDALEIPYTVVVLDGPDGLTLFDTGTGGQLGATAGRMAANMRAAGLDAARVTRIVMTHFHGDHIAGLTDAGGKPTYPNAELVVPKEEWDFWMDDGQASRAPEPMRPAFALVRRKMEPYKAKLRQVEGAAAVADGIQAVPTPGHTPGHTSYLLADGNDQLMVLGDVTNRPELNLRNPGWHLVFDMDPALAESTRRSTFDRVAADRIRCAGYHWPFPAVGHVAKEANGYRFVPVTWSSAV
ncbi:MBL fold metallo-hydrolase [Teichococcus vastitatis]|uniref:MBL fold metallo-hydrolase n=1 Tax=Teichococcus vastitatis TaxID=2307076 RepID=A0ABS9W145_9PROT|nr:MBL fold metallo-hydrolase [Pseudoroseomonas vastitatis]MCI0752565.1 MBL fold metallo-hydrolase [Pseudoroseomonas vastitatis]